MKAETAGEQTIAVGDLEHVPAAQSDGGKASGHGDGPIFKVLCVYPTTVGFPSGPGRYW